MYAVDTRPKPRHVQTPAIPASVGTGMWFLPSRAREQRAKDTMRACADAGQSTPGLLIQDGCKYHLGALPSHWDTLVLGDHVELAGALRTAWLMHPGLDWYGIISDGVRPVTRDWDRLLVAASEGRNFVSCNDNWRRDSRMAGVLLAPGWILEAMGYMFPAGMYHLWTDDIWEQLGAALDNWVYVPGVEVKDWHWANPSMRAEHDASAKRDFRGINLHHNDKSVYMRWRSGGAFYQAVERIKAAWKARTGKDWGNA